MSRRRNRTKQASRAVVENKIPSPGRKSARFLEATPSEAALWHETINPLRGLTMDRAVQIYDNARHGCYADLAWLYQEIEAVDPTLMVCVERRAAAVEELDFQCSTKKAARVGRAWDQKLAEEQAVYLESAYGSCINMMDGVECIAGAFFRGFAHCRPVYTMDGRELLEFVTFDQWNFVRNRSTGAWHWNAEAVSSISVDNAPEIPETELVSLVRPRHVDYPALSIFIRNALGEKQYGVFMERYGVPPVMIIMPQFADPKDEDRYMAAATKVARGGSGALPFGASASYGAEARGADPFTAYFKHQQELVVLLATGGLATSLAMPAGLGDGVSGEHGDTWSTIVNRDARLIAQSLNARVTADLLTAGYPGRPHLASFGFQTEPPPTATEVFEDGAKAVAAGYRITQQDLEGKSGYTLEVAPISVSNAPVPSPALLPAPTAANKPDDAPAPAIDAIDAIEAAALDALAEARSAELSPVIDRLLDALALEDEEAIRTELAAILADLPGIVDAAAGDPDTQELERILADAAASGINDAQHGDPA